MPPRIGFSTSASWNPLSWLIRLVTKSRATHCYFVFWDEATARELVLEAHWTFRLIPYAKWSKVNRAVAEYEWRKSDGSSYLTAAIQHAADWVDDWFDFSGLLGMVPVIIAREWFKRSLRNPLQNPKAYFCSEACAAGLLLSGAPVGDLDPMDTAPGELLDFCQAMQERQPEVVRPYPVR